MKNSARILNICFWGITVVCLFIPSIGYTQTANNASSAPGKDNPTIVSNPSPVPSPTVSVTPSGNKIKNIYMETLYQDIETATYYELVDWCRRLSLSDAGDTGVLKQRLFDFFNLKPAPQSSTPAPAQTPVPSGTPAKNVEAQEQPAGKLIQIRSASSTEYFKIEEINEEYLILRGDVVIEFHDTSEGSTHIISAQRVMVNQTQKLLTAVGDIKYSLEKPGEKPEVFTGESFVFNIESWAGGFVDARGEKTSEITDGKDVKFFYKGANLSRLKNDIIILEKGIITSCEDTDDPHWSIKAQKIWVLAPGEWAVRDAVLHVGRVPVFYLPFFFKPGDDFFFHPVIGYREREGFFIQTTTYLLGQKKSQDSAFSFLRASEENDKEYELILNGLFLKKGKQIDKKTEQDRILKIIADFYTRLGGFTGAVLDLAPAWQLKGGLGFSRNVYLSAATGAYSPYEDDTLESKWNTTPLWGIDLPFRFGFDTNFKFSLFGSAVSINGNMQLFSDPFFEEDFYERSEDIDWLKIIKGNDNTDTVTGGTTNSNTNSSAYDLVVPTTQKTTINWNLNSSVNFPTLPPFISTLRINNINLGWIWNSKDNGDSGVDLYDPSRQFYYPSRWRFPDNLNFQIAGTLFSWNSQVAPSPGKPPAGEPTDIKTGNNFGKGFSFSETNQPDESDKTTTADELTDDPVPGSPGSEGTESVQGRNDRSGVDFIEPDIFGELPVEFGRTLGSSFTIGYSLVPYFTLENQFDYNDWTRPGDVDFSTKYLEFLHSGIFLLDYNYSLWGALLKGSGNFQLSEKYKDRLYNTDDTWDSTSDKINSNLYVNALTIVTLQPLLDLKYFSSSNIEYKLSSDLYKYTYNSSVDAFENQFMDWDKIFVKNHTVRATLNYTPGAVTHSLSLAATLPPLNDDYSGVLNFTLLGMDFFSLNSNVTTGYKKISSLYDEKDHWEFSPLIVTETLKLSTLLSLTETMTWNLNNMEFTEARTIYKTIWIPFWSRYLLEGELIFKPSEIKPLNYLSSTLFIQNFTASFRAQMMEPKELDMDEGKWVVSSTEKEFLPQSLKFAYQYDFKDLRFWKNRIVSDIFIDTYWELVLQEFTNSQFKFAFKWNFEISEFLDFNISIASHNYQTYQYIPAWAKKTGMPWVNPLVDLVKSFNFFDITDRKESNFKLDYIKVGLLHHLHDWDLTFNYAGKQELVSRAGGGSEYRWQPEFELTVEWNPIPELSHKITRQDDNLDLRG